MKKLNKYKSRYWNSLFSPEEGWLVNLLFRGRQSGIHFYSSQEEEGLVEYASKNGLAQIFYRSKSVDYLSGVCKLKLRKEYLSNLGRNTAFHLIGDEICKTLADNNIDTILLKGSFLSRFVYDDAALRPMSDIDILVPEDKAKLAWVLLSGEILDSRQIDRFGHHLPAIIYRGATIEIHDHLFPVNSKYDLPVNQIWEFSEFTEDGKFRVLNPYHQIVYLSLHLYYTFRQGGTRLGWFYDLKRLFSYYGDRINQSDLEDLINSLQVCKPVKLVLALYSILDSGSNMQFRIEESMHQDLKKMILFFRTSGERKLEYSYSVAWERIWHTKGFLNKLAFVHQLVMHDTSSRKSPIFYRLWYLIRNTLRMFWFKFFRK